MCVSILGIYSESQSNSCIPLAAPYHEPSYPYQDTYGPSTNNQATSSPQQAFASPSSPASTIHNPALVSPPHLTSHSSYYNTNNTNLASTYSTPPTRSDTLPPGPGIAISSALPDTSHSLRPYALASSSSSSQGQYQQQQPQLQYRGGGGGTTGSPIPPLSYPSRHQSPLAGQQQTQQQQMYAYSPQRGEDQYSQGGGGRPMSIDGRPSSSSMMPQNSAPPPPPPPPQPAPAQGFRRVRGPQDLNPRINTQPSERRADPMGNGFLSVSVPVLNFCFLPSIELLWGLASRSLFWARNDSWTRVTGWLTTPVANLILRVSLSGNRLFAFALDNHYFPSAAPQMLNDEPGANVQHIEPSIPIRNSAQSPPRTYEAEQALAQRWVRQRGLRLYPLCQ